MRIGLWDIDSHNFPNLALMKISAYYKNLGHTVEFVKDFEEYDKVFASKIFGDEYTSLGDFNFICNEIICGGTGFAITVENGREIYHKEKDIELPPEIEHQYPDYSLYPELTKDKAYGFLTRGCCNNCDFCIVSQKEGSCSVKVSDLSEFWRGQKEIVLLDPNILACRDRIELLQQLIDSRAYVDFTQGLDARFMTPKIALMLRQVKIKNSHFAFDSMKYEGRILQGLRTFVDVCHPGKRKCSVYILTNYNTSFGEDFYRIKKIQELGLAPDIRIYRKETLPKRHILRDAQRWSNNRIIYSSCPDFWEYAPRVDKKTMRETYSEEYIAVQNYIKSRQP